MTHGLKEVCADLVKWANKNPTGYQRLRQLSIMAVENSSSFVGRVRRASVARKQSMAPAKFGLAVQDDILEEEEQQQVPGVADNVTDLVKSLVMDDQLFGLVSQQQRAPEAQFT